MLSPSLEIRLLCCAFRSIISQFSVRRHRGHCSLTYCSLPLHVNVCRLHILTFTSTTARPSTYISRSSYQHIYALTSASGLVAGD